MQTLKETVWIIRDALRDAWTDLWTGLACNLLWTLSVFLIIPAPAATMALFSYSNRLANGEEADLSDYWQAFRSSWWLGWRWGFINLFVIALLTGDAYLTGRLSFTLVPFIQGFYLAALAGWLLLQLFTLPFLFEMETPSVRRALRNAAVMIGKNPGFSLALAGLLFFLMLLGTVAFMLSFAFGGVVLACAANRAVIHRLAAARQAANPTKSAPSLSQPSNRE